MGINNGKPDANPMISLKNLGLGVGSMLIAGLAALPAWARPATLYANDPASVINIRTRPTLESTVVYLGSPGDRVDIIEETMDAAQMPWYFIQLEGENVSGWVRGDLVSFTVPTASSPNNPPSDGAPGDPTLQGIPTALLEACRTRAFVELDTFRNDITITQARLVSAGVYNLTWRQRSTNVTGTCTVNTRNQVTAFTTAPGAPNNLPAPDMDSRPQTTLHAFRTDDYAVRVYQFTEESTLQPYINLWDIENQTFILDGNAARAETVRDVTVYWLEQEGRSYQIRVLPDRTYNLKISTSDALEYDSNSVE